MNFSSSGCLGIAWTSCKELLSANVFFIIWFYAIELLVTFLEQILIQFSCLNPIQYIIQIWSREKFSCFITTLKIEACLLFLYIIYSLFPDDSSALFLNVNWMRKSTQKKSISTMEKHLSAYFANQFSTITFFLTWMEFRFL